MRTEYFLPVLGLPERTVYIIFEYRSVLENIKTKSHSWESSLTCSREMGEKVRKQKNLQFIYFLLVPTFHPGFKALKGQEDPAPVTIPPTPKVPSLVNFLRVTHGQT